jgi:hypothetical protein
MTHSAQQLEEFKAEFVKRRVRMILVSLPLIAVMLVMVAIGKNAPGTPPIVPEAVGVALLMALALAPAVYTAFRWRCPACNSYIGKRLFPNYCGSCGVALR